MGTILASAIINRAGIQLHDTTPTRWIATELLNWLNEGQREIVLLKPDAYAQNTVMQMAFGTKQSIPASGTVLIAITRNMGTNGSTPGKVIRRVSRQVLDDETPNWHSATPVSAVDNYVFEPGNPKDFYVNSPSDHTGFIEIIYAKAPEEVASVGNVITLDDIYSPALLNYVLYRAYLKDADYAFNAQRSAGARMDFLQLLGRQDLMQIAYNPNLTSDQKMQIRAQVDSK